MDFPPIWKTDDGAAVMWPPGCDSGGRKATGRGPDRLRRAHAHDHADATAMAASAAAAAVAVARPSKDAVRGWCLDEFVGHLTTYSTLPSKRFCIENPSGATIWSVVEQIAGMLGTSPISKSSGRGRASRYSGAYAAGDRPADRERVDALDRHGYADRPTTTQEARRRRNLRRPAAEGGGCGVDDEEENGDGSAAADGGAGGGGGGGDGGEFDAEAKYDANAYASSWRDNFVGLDYRDSFGGDTGGDAYVHISPNVVGALQSAVGSICTEIQPSLLAKGFEDLNSTLALSNLLSDTIRAAFLRYAGMILVASHSHSIRGEQTYYPVRAHHTEWDKTTSKLNLIRTIILTLRAHPPGSGF